MKVTPSPLFVLGFASAAFAAPLPESPALDYSPALPSSPAFDSPMPSTAAAFDTPLYIRGDAYSGQGGTAIGGNKVDNDSHDGGIDIASDNAGDGGRAVSGDSHGGNGGGATTYDRDGHIVYSSTNPGGNAYTGPGGNTNGGSYIESAVHPRAPLSPGRGGNEGPHRDVVHDYGGIDAFSGNAGDGGDSSSGTAFGGDAGPAPIAYRPTSPKDNGGRGGIVRVLGRRNEERRSRTRGLGLDKLTSALEKDTHTNGVVPSGSKGKAPHAASKDKPLVEELNSLKIA